MTPCRPLRFLTGTRVPAKTGVPPSISGLETIGTVFTRRQMGRADSLSVYLSKLHSARN
jgi:hypothetical protein